MDEIIRGLIVGLFDCCLANRNNNRELMLGKIEALSLVLTQNKIYLRDYSKNALRDQEKEDHLAFEWKRVGALFHNDYPALSEVCEYKSGYWINPDLHSKMKVRELGITIANLEDQYKRIKNKAL
ncbi:hypothetical protein [Serratia marcescens]|uniref:hypothetical protein n=1 Tax=Serratia marcescens TaxID=615 RepID=UPI003F7D8045